MTIKTKLSIGIPAYNQGPFLRQTLLSVLNQTQAADEIVVSNNHSTDETDTILREFSGRVKVITPPTHLAMTAHWNFLCSRLSGDWISLLSSDDIAKPNFVETIQRGIRMSAAGVLVRSGWETIDADSNVIEKRHLLSVRKIASPPLNFTEQLLGPKTSFAAFSVKRSAWDAVGGFPSNLSLLGDWGLWLKLAPVGDFVYVHDIISQYRSDYRPEIQARRAVPWLRDEAAICMEIIPEIAFTQLALGEKKIIQARCRRLESCLNEAVKITLEGDRPEAARILTPWAASTGQLALLDSFRDGTYKPRPKEHHFAKKIARSIYARFFA